MVLQRSRQRQLIVGWAPNDRATDRGPGRDHQP